MPPQPKPKPVAEAEQLAALNAALARLAGGDPATFRFGVAVSGGPDSIALLLLMKGLAPGHLEAATVDHQLRPEAADEAAMVATLCAGLAIQHQILRSQVPVIGSIQAGARAMRYALLEEWRAGRGLDFVLTAHHADDQAETLLMRLNRASGVGGLSGIRARNSHVLRPVLEWRRSELAEVCARADVATIDDPSNRDARFDRARVRQQIEALDWLDVPAMARSAELLAGADAALDWAAKQAKTSDELDTIDDEAWPDELGWRVMRDRLSAVAGQSVTDQGQLVNALAALRAGSKVSLGPLTITPDRKRPTRWRIALAPARRA